MRISDWSSTCALPISTFAAIELQDATNFDMLKGATFIGVISLLAWGLGYFGQPHILARFMAADSVKSIPAARRISMTRSEEHTSELQSLMRISYAVFCLKKKQTNNHKSKIYKP